MILWATSGDMAARSASAQSGITAAETCSCNVTVSLTMLTSAKRLWALKLAVVFLKLPFFTSIFARPCREYNFWVSSQ